MILVIDIPEEQYNILKSKLYYTFPNDMKKWGLKAIRNGTPLDDIRAEIIEMRSNQNCSCADCLDIIDKYR